MEKGTRINGARRRITPNAKIPPTPKPKPSKLSTTPSNKIDSEPNSSFAPPKRTNSNRGSNIDRLSSVFEDSHTKLRTAPSLPLSPKLPVPQVIKPYPKKTPI